MKTLVIFAALALAAATVSAQPAPDLKACRFSDGLEIRAQNCKELKKLKRMAIRQRKPQYGVDFKTRYQEKVQSVRQAEEQRARQNAAYEAGEKRRVARIAAAQEHRRLRKEEKRKEEVRLEARRINEEKQRAALEKEEEAREAAKQKLCGADYHKPPRIGMKFERLRTCAKPTLRLVSEINREDGVVQTYRTMSGRAEVYVMEGLVVGWDSY